MKRIFCLSGVWVGICLTFFVGTCLNEKKTTIEVFSEKKMALNIEDAIPDANFRACLTEMVTKGNTQIWDEINEKYVTINYTVDGTKYSSLTEDSLKQISTAACNGKNITNIQGIEYLTNLWELNLSGNKINNLNFNSTNNPKLHLLYLNDVDYQSFEIDDTLSNQLIVLDVSGNNLNNSIINGYISKFPNLQQLRTSDNNLTGELDVSTLKRLQGLWAENNQLTNIKGLADKGESYTNAAGEQVTAKLEYLIIGNNKLSNIDISQNPELLALQLQKNQLSSINLSNNKELIQLWLHDNKITSIDLSKNNNLKDVNLSGNKIANIIITSDNLKDLYLSNTEFSNLTINDNNPNKMASLDFTNCKISQEEIQNIISRFPNLKKLTLNYNSLTSLDVSNLSTLEILNVYQNKLDSIKLPNTDNLLELNLSVNNLNSLDLSTYTKLERLYITSNPNLKNLDLSNNTNLKSLGSSLSGFSDNLDLSNNTKLEYLSINASFAKNLDFNKFPNLKQVFSVYYLLIPVYGTSISTNSLLKFIPSNIRISDYQLHNDFNVDSLYTKDTITGELGQSVNIRIYADNATNTDVTNFSNQQKFNGYYTLRFMKLTSNKYSIDETKNIIDVGGDSDETIRSNLKMSWDDAIFEINSDKLTIKYNNMVVKEFTLQRVTNPKTGEVLIYGVLFILCISITILLLIPKTKKLNNKV